MSVCVIGSINLDLVARVAELPRPGETVLASALSRHAGGKGLNQAVAAARAGARVRMIGRVGVDEAGDWLLRVLDQAGVDAAQVGRDPAAPTGQAMITVADDGENCIVVVAGANASLPPPAPGAAQGARVLLAQLETALAPVSALLALAPLGCTKVLNAAPATPEGAQLFASCDLLVLNQTELAAYSRRPVPVHDLDQVASAARSLPAQPGRSVVVTLGAQGVLLVDAATVQHLPGRPARVVDTVGAGDCFCGVLAAGLDEGLTLPAAAARANIAAALAVGRPGAADAMPTQAELDAAAKALDPTRPSVAP